MQIDPIARTVSLSVRELALFRQYPGVESGGHAAPWRAALGQDWHKHAEAEIQKQVPEARFEYAFSAKWQHAGWHFHFGGRIDQILPEAAGHCFREVKSIRHPLPESVENLETRYPDYFAQAAIYLALANVLPEFAEQSNRAELYFINIENGAIQTIELDADHETLFQKQLEALTRFLDFRRHSRLQLQNARFQPAFSQLREGQQDLLDALETSTLQSKTLLLEAPTGFGKTGIVLEHALKHLQNGQFERCIYLTTKSTGQLETVRQLKRMVGNQLHYIQMRNRSELAIESFHHTCHLDGDCESSNSIDPEQSELDPTDLLRESGTLTPDQAKAVGSETGVCPYTLVKSCLPYAEMWIGDVNYIFAPQSQAVFLEADSLNAERTLLIIDEAHNLPTRVADSLSVELSAADLLFALEALRGANATRRLIATGQELIRYIESKKESSVLLSNALYEVLDLTEDFSRQLKEASLNYSAIAPYALDVLWRIPLLAERLDAAPQRWLHWIQNSILKVTCLDASDWIQQMLRPFGARILMSATLQPQSRFADACGIPSNDYVFTQGHAPWRENAYECAIDARVDTRFKSRERYYEVTARTVGRLIHQNPGAPIAVFFPSYQYAENIKAYLEALHPEYRILSQPRGVGLDAQQSFIETGLLMADALFLILGSSYSEGVDQLGGKVQAVMIVSPALPEVNAIQDAKMQAHSSMRREDAFADVYIRPAMQRIHQALGRIVRAPGQRAQVLLHGKRFAESEYQMHLAPEYSEAVILQNDADLIDWLQKSSRK